MKMTGPGARTVRTRNPALSVSARHTWNREPGFTTRLPTPLWSDHVIHARPLSVTPEH
ncbi:hypothetical protein PGTUg99_005224 [Puccinia graminis f. sp. tritici]|uniref:Uncharacterized protein n=1 Tax=Puccinia graminis f. sp. tritici TaxID=56615 RepID=A0A5B0RD40_PUCGR|nr:hypothetical protein PGTUg99_005224 [Puccinia graminis f. sp. tritici]